MPPRASCNPNAYEYCKRVQELQLLTASPPNTVHCTDVLLKQLVFVLQRRILWMVARLFRPFCRRNDEFKPTDRQTDSRLASRQLPHQLGHNHQQLSAHTSFRYLTTVDRWLPAAGCWLLGCLHRSSNSEAVAAARHRNVLNNMYVCTQSAASALKWK